MQAFHDIRIEMRESCTRLTSPAMRKGDAPRIDRMIRMNRRRVEEPAIDHIDPWMEVAFEGLTHASETGEPYALVPCFMNGEPAAVIAIVQPVGSKVHVMPLFLACQPWMSFGGPPDDTGDEGGGSDRTAAADPPAPR